ncbi:hypothetical protein Pint_36611 [Pistacia integerrima]|uniref:Uncharacterized protein n=1 Tax=Pistacia integerrima TaxID=434235 RepID=A0ACC0Y137_9ROSI|nr:hypothetical protein Pint_36611 [Pistacia integerrima]
MLEQSWKVEELQVWFLQILQRGLTPDAVTYNALICVYNMKDKMQGVTDRSHAMQVYNRQRKHARGSAEVAKAIRAEMATRQRTISIRQMAIWERSNTTFCYWTTRQMAIWERSNTTFYYTGHYKKRADLRKGVGEDKEFWEVAGPQSTAVLSFVL